MRLEKFPYNWSIKNKRSMPTGLTYEIYGGTDTSFRKYALRCATHMGAGAVATNRGDTELPIDKAPVIEPDSYHKEMLKEAGAKLKHWVSLKVDPEEAKREYDLEVARRIEENAAYLKKDDGVKEKYVDMKRRVEEWNPGKEYAPLKKLMLDQLDDSLNFDCHFEEYLPYKEPLPPVDEWIDSHIGFCLEEIKYHSEKYAEDCKRASECTAYLKGLYESLDKFEEEEQNG